MKVSMRFLKGLTNSKKSLSRENADSALELGTVDGANPESQSREQVLLNEDLMSKVFEQLSFDRPAGFSNIEIASYGLVCRAWRQASRQLPIAFTFSRRLSAQQEELLKTCDQKICALTFVLGDPAAYRVVLDPGFADRQGQCLRTLWNVSDSRDPGLYSTLEDYPNLEKLFLSCDHALKATPVLDLEEPDVVATFASLMVAKHQKLRVLSLRNFEYMDLRSLPTSLQVLYVGRSELLTDHCEDFGRSPDSITAPNDLAASPFPSTLKLSQAIVNYEQGGWLGRPLSDYFSVASRVICYSRMFLMARPVAQTCGTFAETLSKSAVDMLKLEFDHITLARPRLAPAAENGQAVFYGWQTQLFMAEHLAKMLADHLTDFDVQYQRGGLYKHSITFARLT